MPRYDSDSDERRDSRGSDREISLGTGTVLAIFLALALVCSLFFGLGYSMGKKSAPLVPVAAAVRTTPPNEEVGKQASGLPVTSRPSAARPDLQVTQPLQEGSDSGNRATAEGSHKNTSKVVVRDRTAPVELQTTDTETSAPAATGAGQTFVQIAAVSRKEDAELLLGALRKRGYTGLLRQQPQDKLLHVQVGPFPSKKEAELMRQRLIVDGYNPIIK